MDLITAGGSNKTLQANVQKSFSSGCKSFYNTVVTYMELRSWTVRMGLGLFWISAATSVYDPCGSNVTTCMRASERSEAGQDQRPHVDRNA